MLLLKKAEAGRGLGHLVPKGDLDLGSQILVWITWGLGICHQGPRGEKGICGR